MAHEILSIKLCELEDQIARLLARIRLSETADSRKLRQGIRDLRQECTENERILQEKLQLSRAAAVSTIAHGYAQIQEIIRENGAVLQARASEEGVGEAGSEEKILLAEYALDFALQAANRALLLSMEAIDAQSTQQEEERRLS